MAFNSATAFIFSVVELYNNALDLNPDTIRQEDERAIVKLFRGVIDEGKAYDYYSAKTYLVMEIISLLLCRNYGMATAIFEILKKVDVDKFNCSDEKMRSIRQIRHYNLLHTDVSDTTILHDKAVTRILVGLHFMGYNFHPEFVQRCAREFQTIHNL